MYNIKIYVVTMYNNKILPTLYANTLHKKITLIKQYAESDGTKTTKESIKSLLNQYSEHLNLPIFILSNIYQEAIKDT